MLDPKDLEAMRAYGRHIVPLYIVIDITRSSFPPVGGSPQIEISRGPATARVQTSQTDVSELSLLPPRVSRLPREADSADTQAIYSSEPATANLIQLVSAEPTAVLKRMLDPSRSLYPSARDVLAVVSTKGT